MLVRTPSKVQIESSYEGKYELIKGDSSNEGDVQRAVAGCDVVVSSLGNSASVKSDSGYIMERSARNIFEAAAASPKKPRCMLITTIGCGGTSWLVNFMLSLFIGFKNIADYDATDKLAVEETRIPVLLVRPHQLTDKDGSGKYETRHEKSGNTFLTPIPRADVAKFLVDALSDTQWDNKGGVQLTGSK
mmetsp:Transcript_18903/g.36759  ORF Transcript_18903/g.36759 Transcript_18903/m.36759 type:complete len:189 (-) Transcript_18903:59-625(-)